MKCMFLLLTILLILPYTCPNYTLSCPSKEQWWLRSSSRCNDTYYYCLLDINADGYREQCLPFPAKDTKGFRKVFAGNIDGIECAPDTYQPFWFWTNGSSGCVYMKSLCTEEGQVVQDDGSNEVDRRCRCDYRYGYNYVTKPRDICNCVPSEEDCSCYRMSCPQGQLLTPDYECRKVTEWKQTFGCPDVTSSSPDEESTVIHVVSKMTSKEHTPVSRNAAPLFVLTCLLLLLLTRVLLKFALWKFCKSHKQDENIAMKTVYIDTQSEVIPQSIRESQQESVEKFIGGHCQTVSVLISDTAATKQNLKTLNTAINEGNQGLAKNIAIADIINLADESEYTRLHEAVMKDNLDIKNMLIDKNAINCKDSQNRTPLHYACEKGSSALVKLLIEHGANHLPEDGDGKLPLHVSCENGNTDIIELLLSKVKDSCSDESYRKHINSFDNLGNSPLSLSCSNNKIQAVELMLLQKVDVNLPNYSSITPIHVAVAGGFVDICSSLINYKADVNCLNKDKQTPLHLACHAGHIDIIKLLLSSGASLDVQDKGNQTPLHLACHAGHVDIVKLLLSNGAILDVQDKDKQTPLHLSSLTGNIDIAKLLLQKELLIKREPALLHMKDNYDMLPVFIACSHGHDKLVQYYIDMGSDINYRNKDGQTPLIIACQEGHIDVVRVLLNASVDICKPDFDGWSPLFVACTYDRQDIVSLLIDHKADVNQTTITDGNSPLHQTSASGNNTLSALLVKHGALVNQQNKLGETPLWKASLSEHKNLMNYLLKRGADKHIRNKSGHLLKDHPRIKKNRNLLEILSS